MNSIICREKVPKRVSCKSCSGNGASVVRKTFPVEEVSCFFCNSNGWVIVVTTDGEAEEICPECHGEKILEKYTSPEVSRVDCHECDGRGYNIVIVVQCEERVKWNCKACEGSGEQRQDEYTKCKVCDGVGLRTDVESYDRNGFLRCSPECGDCSGTGKNYTGYHMVKCMKCRGKGIHRKKRRWEEEK